MVGPSSPPPTSAPSTDGFDPHSLPDYDIDFINEDDLRQFEKALTAPEASPLVALNDWRPIRQRVRRPGGRRKTRKRSKDETREGFVYTFLKWPFLAIVFGWIIVLGISYLFTRLYIYLYEHNVAWTGKRQRLRKELHETTTYDDWLRAAKRLDAHLGSEKWMEEDEYAYYDHLTIDKVTSQLAQLREKVEEEERNGTAKLDSPPAIDKLRSLLEACIKNNFVGVENPRLYSETYSGTKALVQDFVDEAHACLELLLKSGKISEETKHGVFKHLDNNYGRTVLCLSGGATFAYYHFGVVKALLDNDVLPEIVSGTSGGALVAALVATRTDEELKQLLVPALAHRIRACRDGMSVWIRRWWRTGARFDTMDWAKQCSWFCRGSTTFREAYERTGRILNVSCVPSDPHSPTILANYLTSPDCVIWSAVIASAAVPGILNPVVLMMKNKDGTLGPYSFGHKWKDGSLRTDIPLKALNVHFNANFSIVSQVNPHINLFFFSSRGTVGRPVTHRKGRGWRGGFLGSAVEQYIKLDMNKWLRVLRHLELLPRPLGQDWSEIWLQRFSGTITIWPKSAVSDYYNILSDPSPQRLARMLHMGQQSAFPKIQFIRNRAKIERVIVEGLRRTAPSTAASSSNSANHDPVSQRPAATEYRRRERNRPHDAVTDRLDHALPKRRVPGPGPDPETRFESGYLVVPGQHDHPGRRGSVLEEVRRQSAVFFDDTTDFFDGDGDDDTATSEDGNVIAGEDKGTRVG